MLGGDKDGSYLKGGGVEFMGLPLCRLVLYGSKWSVGQDFVNVGDTGGGESGGVCGKIYSCLFSAQY